MQKMSLLSAVVGLLFLVAGRALGDFVSHYANPQVGEQIILNYTTEGAGWNSGGPFTATLFHANNTQDVWTTFCVEAGQSDEDFNPGQTYQVLSTNLNVASDTGNYVTDAAKWLYYQSLHDPSLLVGYIPGDINSDSELQEAIWHGVLAGGVSGSPLDTNYDATAQTWFNAAAAATVGGAWADANLVRVINPAALDYSGGPQAQSQLYETVPYPDPVPEPSTIVLLGIIAIGLLACAWPEASGVGQLG